MNRCLFFVPLIVLFLFAGCASAPVTRPGDVEDYDTFYEALTFAWANGKTDDAVFLKKNFPDYYAQLIDKLVVLLSSQDITALEKEAATELFYWAESLGRIKEFKELK